MPAVVMRDHTTKALFAHVVPGKGADFEWTARQVVSDIAKMGYTRVVIRSDQEPAITAMVDKIRELRNEETIVEWSPAHDKDANGMAERGVQAVEGLARTLKLELEDKLRHKIPVDHPVVTWLIQHAADMLTKLEVKKNGRTAYESHTAENLWGLVRRCCSCYRRGHEEETCRRVGALVFGWASCGGATSTCLSLTRR